MRELLALRPSGDLIACEFYVEGIEDGSAFVGRPLRFAVTDEPIDGEFFPAVLSGAIVIMVANPLPQDRSRWQVTLWLDKAAPHGLALSGLGVRDFDLNYGGRWNAGSNRRGGGTALSPEDYAEHLAINMASHLPTILGEE